MIQMSLLHPIANACGLPKVLARTPVTSAQNPSLTHHTLSPTHHAAHRGRVGLEQDAVHKRPGIWGGGHGLSL